MKLAVVSLLIFAAQVFAESNDSPAALKRAQTEVQLKLDQFARDSADYEPLLAAQKLSASLNPRGDKTHLSQLDEGCLRLQLKVLLALAHARDPLYDREAPQNIVYLNVVPPPSTKITLENEPAMSAGIDPHAIKDPEVRRAYEDAIAQNQQRNEKLNREMAISRGMDRALIGLWIFAKRGFPENSGSRKAAIEIVQKTIPDKILLDRFNSGTMPGLTW